MPPTARFPCLAFIIRCNMNYQDILEPRPEGYSDEYIGSFLRQWRNAQLAASDWTQLSDVSLSNKTEWAAYRQALRDLTNQGSDPKVWVLPTRPE